MEIRLLRGIILIRNKILAILNFAILQAYGTYNYTESDPYS